MIAGGKQDRGSKPPQLRSNRAGVGVGVIEQVAGDENHIGLKVIGLGDDVGKSRRPD